jgi:hypothetical protein
MTNNGGHTRPKGYMDWKPRPETARVVKQAIEIINEYKKYGPMTVRQIFYRLVGNYGYDKTEKAYKRLCEYMVKARRSQIIPFHHIRDDGGTTYSGGPYYKDMYGFMDHLAENSVDDFLMDPRRGQTNSMMVFCEAEGMVPMLANMVAEYGVPVTGTGGFSSLTVTHSIAMGIVRSNKPTYFLHIGDYDPSGESIFTSMSQDIGKFVAEHHGGAWSQDTGETFIHPGDDGYDFRPVRVALTPEQVEEYDLPTAPAKPSDTRSRNWVGETTQAEALPPDLLKDIVVDAVESRFDMEKLEKVRKEEQEQREIMGERVEDAIREVRNEIFNENG